MLFKQNNYLVEDIQENIQFQLTNALVEKVEILVEDQNDKDLKT